MAFSPMQIKLPFMSMAAISLAAWKMTLELCPSKSCRELARGRMMVCGQMCEGFMIELGSLSNSQQKYRRILGGSRACNYTYYKPLNIIHKFLNTWSEIKHLINLSSMVVRQKQFLILCQNSYIYLGQQSMQNQQAQVQEFLSNFVHIQNTPPDLANQFLNDARALYEQISEHQTLGFLLYKMAQHIMKLKTAVNPEIQWMVEQCIYDIISKAVASEFRVGSQALKVIFDNNCDYYKHNNLDPSLKLPLGSNRKLNWYEPEVGESVDVVKPYITSTSYCSWTRGILVSKENKKYTVKYDNTEATATYKDLPFFDQLGTRTTDYDWRMALEVGSLVDAFNRVWYPATVVEVGSENGSKRVRITFRRFSQKGQKVDSHGYRYDGLGPNEDDWIDVLSYRIQLPGKMAKDLCYYSHVSQEPLLDDTYDLIFEKQYQQAPFWGIMRCTYTRSTSYLNFFDHLCSQGGYDIFLRILQQKDYPMDPLLNMMMIFGYTSFIVPRMGLQRYLPKCLSQVLTYIKENFKQFNGWKLDIFYHFVNNIGSRIYSLTQKHKILNDVRKFLIVQYLKLNLEKNLIALKFLFELIKPLRPYQNELEKKQFDDYLVQNQIFYKIIQNNVHDQVLSRSVDLLKYMMDSQLIGWNQIEHIWNVIPHSDLRGRATIQKLLGDISKSFTQEYSQKLIDMILRLKETDLTVDKLNLLRMLKDREVSNEHKEKILYYLWQCLTTKSTNIKQNVEEQIQSVYRGFIATIKHNQLKLKVIQSMLKRIREINNVRNQLVLFREFIMTYPRKVQSTNHIEDSSFPQTIKEVIQELKNQQIYETVLRLLAAAKNKERIETTLEFLQFLFDYDSDDISSIVKMAYEILGPSDVFLLWAKNLAYRALNFFIGMYQNTQNMQKFEKITNSGLDSIKTILLDINFYKGNIKILKKRKTTTQLVGPVQAPSEGPSSSIGTSTSDYSVPQKEEVLTFIYILKSPFECIGLNFLLHLLQYISSNSVYNDIIKLIIQFIVNLDDKIVDKAQLFMEQFLERIMKSIQEIAQNSVFSNEIKLQLDIYLNLLQQLFAETEKNGLGRMIPHFSTIQGETLKLKIQNTITNSDIHKKEPYIIEVNENMTLWRFKTLLSEVYNLPASKVDVIKYVNPIEDSNNGKSLSELFFFNQEGIKVSKRDAKDIPRFELLSQDNSTMTDRYEAIIETWFNKYKNDQEMMCLEELMKLGAENWSGSIMKEKDKLMTIITKGDKDQKGGLYLNQFKDYFIRAAYENNAMVWRLLNLSGYKNNLRHRDDPEPEINENSYPRKILSHKFVYTTIFSILSNQVFQPLHLNFYRFLGMLETDHHLSSEIKGNIKDFFQNQKCMYKLSYGLQTLLNELESNLELFGEFYEHKGHLEIAQKLAMIFGKDESVYKFEQFTKVIVIPNLLRILSLYVYPLICENKYIRFLKKIKINQTDTVDIIKKIEKEENYAEDQPSKRQLLQAKAIYFNFEELYKLTFKILDNLVVNYDKEFLVRLTNQIAKLYGYLAVVYPQFKPEDLFKGNNSESLNIRRACHALTYIYLLQHKQYAFALLEKLILHAPKEIKTISQTYYDLLAIVIEKTIEFEPQNQQTDELFTKIASELIGAFFKCPNETRGSLLPNKTINGVLATLLLILQKKPKIGQLLSTYKQQFIRKGLFFYSPKEKMEKLIVDGQLLLSPTQIQHFDDYVKCKSQQNRKILMEVIYCLYSYSKDDKSVFFEEFILPIFNELGDTSKKNALKSMYVGLTNYGSTCYMNSMLQVLNSFDIFRNAIMMSDMAEAQTPLIHQLKSLFSYLYFSERIDYGPKNLLSSFVPPINPGIQQDTTEFLNFLFDQVEGSLKSTPYKNILPELFQGNQVAQMICHNCGAKRERIQQFFTYSVEIQGKYDLHTALEGMHGGELISDCLCETCQTRSDTTKRNVLNKVPNIFFVHLKRIVFNYDIFMNTKIHTRLYFPDELNFEPYTKEGLELRETLGVEYLKTLKENEEELKKFEELTLHGHPKEYYQLQLKGIIVHSGTPDVGHYYTILRKGDNWVKFDDSRVSTFAKMQFEEECYGGSWIADEWGGPGSSKNAYVLVYEKVAKNDIELEMTTGENGVEKKIVPHQEFSKTFNTVQWYKEVWLDNHSLMLEQQLISENYNKQFLNFVCKMLELISSNATIELISEILFKVSALSGEVGSLPDIFSKNLHLIRVQMFQKYILEDPKRTFNLLFHQQAKVREFVSFYIERIAIHTYLNGSEGDRAQVIKFIQEYLNVLHGEAAKNWLRIDGYFKMFERLIETSVRVPECYDLYRFFIGNDLLAYFIDFILQKNSPLNFIQKKYSLGTKSNPVNFQAGLGFVATLIKHSFGMTGNNYEVPAIDPKYLFHLSDNAIVCVSSMPFYQKMIKENQNPEAIAFIIQRLSINNLNFSDSVARVLLKIVNENTEISDELDTVLLCVNRFLRIVDSLWIKRAEAVLGTPTPFIYQKNILSSLDEEKYVYPSTLEDVFPLESLLNYAYINRLRVPLTVLNILKNILEVTSMNNYTMDYLLKMPSPSYLHLRYVDWVRPYVNEVANHLNLSEKKREEVASKISICNLYLDDLEKRKGEMSVLIIGEIGQKKLVHKIVSACGEVQVNMYDVPVYVAESSPTGTGNSTFDKYLSNGRLETPVTEDSNILKFFKQLNKPLAIKGQPVEEPEDKEIVGLFDENPYPANTNAGTSAAEQPPKDEKMEVEIAPVQQIPEERPIESKTDQVIREQVNLQNIRLSEDYLRYLQFINKSDIAKIAILTVTDYEGANHTLPSALKSLVSKGKQEFYFTKHRPSQPWGQVEYNLYVCNKVDSPRPFFRTYPSPFIQANQSNQNSFEQKENLFNQHNQMEIQEKKEDKGLPENGANEIIDGMMNCPVCTLLNPVSNVNCEVCDVPLH